MSEYSEYLAEIAAALTRMADAAEVRNMLILQVNKESNANAQRHTEKIAESVSRFVAAVYGEDEPSAQAQALTRIAECLETSLDDKAARIAAALERGNHAAWGIRPSTQDEV